jgi:hypothetical protein
MGVKGDAGGVGVSSMLAEAMSQLGSTGSNVSVQVSSQRQKQTRTVAYETSGELPEGMPVSKESALAMQENLLRSLQQTGNTTTMMGKIAETVTPKPPPNEEGVHRPPTTPQPDDKLLTDQQKESVEEGFIDPDGNIVVSKKVTRIVTTTKTVYGEDGAETTETSKRVDSHTEDGGRPIGDPFSTATPPASLLQHQQQVQQLQQELLQSATTKTTTSSTTTTTTTDGADASAPGVAKASGQDVPPLDPSQPLIRLKVNENVYRGVMDQQQHIHLVPDPQAPQIGGGKPSGGAQPAQGGSPTKSSKKKSKKKSR